LKHLNKLTSFEYFEVNNFINEKSKLCRIIIEFISDLFFAKINFFRTPVPDGVPDACEFFEVLKYMAYKLKAEWGDVARDGEVWSTLFQIPAEYFHRSRRRYLSRYLTRLMRVGLRTQPFGILLFVEFNAI